MEKQSLTKYYCALLLGLVLLAGSNNAVAQISPTTTPKNKPTIIVSPPTMQSGKTSKAESDNMLFPIILSMLALVTGGGAIALTIYEIKRTNDKISSIDEKHINKVKSLEQKYTESLNSPVTSQPSQPQETIIRNSTASSNTDVYLEAMIQRLSERITELEENKLQVAQNKEQAINYSKNTYQSHNLASNINPFEKIDITQPLENLAYMELVNTYNTNPKLLEQTAIKVSEPTDSINRRHTDSSQKIVLEKANNSNYWVIHNELSRDCWLLPKSKLRIDQFRYETTKALFECHGYHPEYSTFKLVKPAKVIPLSSDEQTWQLEEPGILEFSVEA